MRRQRAQVAAEQRRAEPGQRRRLRALLRPARERDAAADDQPLLRARRGDVHDAPLLGRGALAGAIAQALVGERLLARAVEPDEPQADLAAGDEQVLVAVGGPLAAEVGDADDRELEALGGVDRHQPHGLDVAELDRRVGLARLGLELGGREIREPADVAAAVALEGGGEPQQLVDVRQAARAAGERQDVQVVGRRIDDAAQQLVEREAGRERAFGGEAHREGIEPFAVVGGQPLAQLAVAGDRAPGMAATGARDVHQRVRRQTDERRGEHAVQRRLVARVGERGEPRAEVAHDLAAPVAAPADRHRQQPLLLERAFEDRQVAERAQQHDDVLRPVRAGVDEV